MAIPATDHTRWSSEVFRSEAAHPPRRLWTLASPARISGRQLWKREEEGLRVVHLAVSNLVTADPHDLAHTSSLGFEGGQSEQPTEDGRHFCNSPWWQCQAHEAAALIRYCALPEVRPIQS